MIGKRRLRPTGRGLCLALAATAFIATALVFERSDALMAGIVLAAAVASSWLCARFARPPATFVRSLTSGTLAPGSRVEVRLTPVPTSGFVPAPGCIRDRTPWLEAEVNPDPTGTALGYSFVVAKRGVYQIGPAQITMPGPLGLFAASYLTAPPAELLVAPKLVDVEVIAPDAESDIPQPRTQVGAERVTEPAAVRDYQSGDPRRLVHWKATARRDRLMVREVVLRGLPQAWVLVDDSALADDAAEAALSISASVALRLLRAGHTVHLTYLDGAENLPAGDVPRAGRGTRMASDPVRHLSQAGRDAALGGDLAGMIARPADARFEPSGVSAPLLEAFARIELGPLSGGPAGRADRAFGRRRPAAADGLAGRPDRASARRRSAPSGGLSSSGASDSAASGRSGLAPANPASASPGSVGAGSASPAPGAPAVGALALSTSAAKAIGPAAQSLSHRLFAELGARGSVAPIYGALAGVGSELLTELGRVASIARPGQLWLTGPALAESAEALRAQGWIVAGSE
ncbi:MAG: DUF58 domain-containing protein [Bifidobacteriaceae bacterium]|jgi:uncharacterized protein (DUF58 family)|nr:DUF58 domain-containing protein [Bifidobacteriaceae bacterium]